MSHRKAAANSDRSLAMTGSRTQKHQAADGAQQSPPDPQTGDNLARLAEPFSVDPHALYPLGWLRDRLRGIVELETLMRRLGLEGRRVFRDALTGREILDALAAAQPYKDQDRSTASVYSPAPARREKARPSAHEPLRRLTPADIRKGA